MREDDFWGNARDFGLVAVGIISFSGAVYTFSYAHILGIDFSQANTEPVALLISASRVFVTNAAGLVAITILAVVAAGLNALLPAERRFGARVRGISESKVLQVAGLLTFAFLACFLAYNTARTEIAFIRSGHANPCTITFTTGAEAKYPQLVRQFNAASRLLVVFDTADNLYVLVQQTPDPTIPTPPDAQVFSIRKSDILSVETHVP